MRNFQSDDLSAFLIKPPLNKAIGYAVSSYSHTFSILSIHSAIAIKRINIAWLETTLDVVFPFLIFIKEIKNLIVRLLLILNETKGLLSIYAE